MYSNITPSIYSIGVDDHAATIFEEQYRLDHGMSYNSYVIVDEKIAILDTIEQHLAKEWEENLDFVLAGRTPDYLIVHHMEPDHSDYVAAMMRRFENLTLVTGRLSVAMIPQLFGGETFEGRVRVVGDGDTLELGTHKLTFYNTPMVHWPEVIMSYESTEKVLFSADGFGKFGVTDYDDGWLNEARRYYCNIVGKYGPQVQNALKKLSSLDITTVASLHGPKLTGDEIARAVSHYDLWSRYEPEEPQGVLVAYASIYGGTAAVAERAAQMLRQQGVEVVEMNLTRCDMAEAVAQAFRMGKIVLAAPTYDAGLYPPMLDFLTRLRIKGLQRRRIALIENGSWAPQAARFMADMLAQCKDMTVVDAKVTIRSRANEATAAQLQEMITQLTK